MRFEVLGFFPPTNGVKNGSSSLARFPGVPIVLFSGAPGGLLATVLFRDGVPEWIVLFVLEFGVLAKVRGVRKEKGAGLASR